MKSKKRYWVPSSTKSLKTQPSESEKENISNYFIPLIEDFKKQYIPKKPKKEFNYLVDIYSKWYQNYFYLCEKYRAEYPDRIKDEFEMKFVRLKYTRKDQFELSYCRHTGQWQLVFVDLTLEDCKEMILSIPTFQPIG
jgi:hypothetical protein